MKFLTRSRTVSHFWSDRLHIFLLGLQVFALFHWIGRSEYWSGSAVLLPYSWLYWTKPLVAINLDIVGLVVPVVNNQPMYFAPPVWLEELLLKFAFGSDLTTLFSVVYLIVALAIPYAVFLLYVTVRLTIRLLHITTQQSSGKLKTTVFLINRASVWLYQVFYIPVVLAATRCVALVHPAHGAAAVDSVITIPTVAQTPLAAVGAIVLITYAVIPIFVIGIKVNAHLVHSDRTAHERYIRSKEAEYLCKLSEDYRLADMNLQTSFTRHWVFMLPGWGLLKLVVVVLTVLPVYSIVVTLAALLVLAVPFAVASTFWPVYRSRFLSLQVALASWGIVTNLAITTSRIVSLQNAMLQPVLMFIWLCFINGAVACSIAAVGAVAIIRGDGWPVSDRTLSLTPEIRSLITSIRRSARFIAKMQRTPVLLTPIDEVEFHLFFLHRFWRIARHRRLMFEPTVGALLEDLTRIFHARSSVSMLPNKCLEPVLPYLVPRLQQRAREYILVPRSRTRILTKLLALRMFAEHIKDIREWQPPAPESSVDEDNTLDEFSPLAVTKFVLTDEETTDSAESESAESTDEELADTHAVLAPPLSMVQPPDATPPKVPRLLFSSHGTRSKMGPGQRADDLVEEAEIPTDPKTSARVREIEATLQTLWTEAQDIEEEYAIINNERLDAREKRRLPRLTEVHERIRATQRELDRLVSPNASPRKGSGTGLLLESASGVVLMQELRLGYEENMDDEDS